MDRIANTRLEGLARELGHAERLLEEGHYEKARELAEHAMLEARGAGVTSASAYRLLAAACERLGILDEALYNAQRAVELDPLSRDFRRMLDEVARRIRQRLVDERPEGDGQEAPALYAMLQKVGATDDVSHLVMARHHLRRGDREAALRVCDALTLLNPTLSEAWLLQAEVLRALGQEERAVRCEAAAKRAAPEWPRGLVAVPPFRAED